MTMLETVYKKKEYAKAAIRKALKAGNRSEYEVRPVDGGFQIFQSHNTPKAPSLQFGEPSKDRFQYADGASGMRYAVGPSTRYNSQFALFSKAEDDRRFKFEAPYASLEDAVTSAQRAEED